MSQTLEGPCNCNIVFVYLIITGEFIRGPFADSMVLEYRLETIDR